MPFPKTRILLSQIHAYCAGTVQGSADRDQIPFVNSPQQVVMILMSGSHHGGHVSQQEMS